MELICAYSRHWFLSFVVLILILNLIVSYFYPIKGEKNILGIYVSTDKDYIESTDKRNTALMWTNTIAFIAHVIIVLMNYDDCKKKEKLDLIRDYKEIASM